MNNKETLDIAELVAMRKRFYELRELGLLGFYDRSVHLSEISFKELFDLVEVNPINCEEFPYEHSFTVDGVKFFCMSKSDKL